MLVTVDVLKLSRRRDALRLVRRPRRLFTRRPAFARAMLRARDWRGLTLLEVAVIAAWEEVPAETRGERAAETWRGVFELERAHGTLCGENPLGPPSAVPAHGPGVIWTVGNARVRRLPAFLWQNAKVVQELERAPGLRTAFGVLGLWRRGPWMCTLSLWDDVEQGLAFAYRSSPDHREAMRRLRAGVYGTRESYFARLRLVDSAGSIDGSPPFAAEAARAA